MNVLIFFQLKNIKRDDYLKMLYFLLFETSNFMLDTQQKYFYFIPHTPYII